MPKPPPLRLSRRRFTLLAASLPLAAAPGALGDNGIERRRIPSSGEMIPAIGMGSWLTFNVAPYTEARERRVEVLRQFFSLGGTVLDSSPMYGLSEATLGYCLDRLSRPPHFAATKVWIPTRLAGIAQMKASQALWGGPAFDLMQVHNMLDWQAHLPTLRQWKEEARIRYIGITTSHGRRHEAMEKVIESESAFDFVQFSYSIADREAERRLLPAAGEAAKAVIINRPFRTGALLERLRGKPLPPWASEIGCSAWSQFLLKFVISHPNVSCVIPATSRADHMVENMAALRGPLPDRALRRRMASYVESL